MMWWQQLQPFQYLWPVVYIWIDYNCFSTPKSRGHIECSQCNYVSGGEISPHCKDSIFSIVFISIVNPAYTVLASLNEISAAHNYVSSDEAVLRTHLITHRGESEINAISVILPSGIPPVWGHTFENIRWRKTKEIHINNKLVWLCIISGIW